jgi:hypothetical protein
VFSEAISIALVAGIYDDNCYITEFLSICSHINYDSTRVVVSVNLPAAAKQVISGLKTSVASPAPMKSVSSCQ